MATHSLPASTEITLQKLAQYKQLLDDDINDYSSLLLEEWGSEHGEFSRAAVEAYCSVLARGGKRLRGALVMNAYEMFGGTDQQLILPAARAIEMIHAYVLIIDDICDRSDLRRGGDSAHKLLEKYHNGKGLHGDSAHFGISIAMNAAMAGSHLALTEIGRLPINDTVKLEAMNNINSCLLKTIHGQFNDIFNESLQQVTEAQVRDVLTAKTAWYTFLNPIQLGAILSEAGPGELDLLQDYAVHAGLSFQLIDDIIGTFGDSGATGKRTDDDLKEGKITLLVARALSHANETDRSFLLSQLGNWDMSLEQFQECRRIIQDSGALDYVRQLAEQSSAKAVAALDNAPDYWRSENVAFLHGLATYIVSRNK
ncbi:hypothetical protein CYG49_03235 [Candidatus Saccharibacteria bacterium]|nr:MAG: hypothetical protein CYG49_03235 [Candidatus Saccharibacteria bacterium]